jgi:hypothetical protein
LRLHYPPKVPDFGTRSFLVVLWCTNVPGGGFVLDFNFLSVCFFILGARGSVADWSTMQQVGRSRIRFPLRSLDFSINLILPGELWPWGQLSL